MFVSQVAGSLCRSSFNESQQEFPSTTNSSFNQITAYEIKLSKDNHPFSYPNAISSFNAVMQGNIFEIHSGV